MSQSENTRIVNIGDGNVRGWEWMKSFTVGWRGSSPQSLHDYNNGPAGTGTAGTADRVLATSLSEKYGIDTIKICDNPSYHYLHLHSIMYTLTLHIFSNSIEIRLTDDDTFTWFFFKVYFCFRLLIIHALTCTDGEFKTLSFHALISLSDKCSPFEINEGKE